MKHLKIKRDIFLTFYLFMYLYMVCVCSFDSLLYTNIYIYSCVLCMNVCLYNIYTHICHAVLKQLKILMSAHVFAIPTP